MKEKEKYKKMFLSKKRIFLSLVFLGFIFLFMNFSFDGFLFGKNIARGQDAFGGWEEQGYSVIPGSISGGIKKVGEGIKNAAVNTVGSGFLWVINVILYSVFKLVMTLVYIMAVIFDWAVSAENFKAVMDMSAIQEGWKIVRDFLNIFFILVLLFSAFCTIFQVEKYHIKKILLTLVIMAMLVNFSFPISRFIIDAGNIPMYYFLQVIGGDGKSISKNLWNTTNGGGNKGLEAIILPDITEVGQVKGDSDQTFGILAAIIFTFSFMITLGVMAFLLVIRILVLAILVIFSPVGFVAAILPSFSKYADSWWEQLFKQSFFGTIMAFMLYISLLIMNEAQNGVSATLKTMAEGSGSGNFFDKVVVAGVTLAIPIVLLWIGIISAQKMGAVGGGMAAGAAAKFGKWAGKKFSLYNAAKRQVDAFKGQRKKREDEKAKNRWGGKLGKFANKQQDKWIGKIPVVGGSAQKRYENMSKDENREDIKKGSEKLEGDSTINIVNNINTSINTPPTDKKGKIDAAAQVKQAMSRGKEFEQEVQRRIIHPDASMATFIANLNATRAAAVPPLGPASPQEIKAAFYAASRKIIQDAENA